MSLLIRTSIETFSSFSFTSDIKRTSKILTVQIKIKLTAD